MSNAVGDIITGGTLLMGRQRGGDKGPRPPPTARSRPTAPPIRPPRPHNALEPYISTETALGCLVLERIKEDGYCVLPAVFSPEECAAEYERLWAFAEATAPGVKRSEPDSWYPDKQAPQPTSGRDAAAPIDPWPHSGWGNLPDMCQSYQGGWLFSDLREKLARRARGAARERGGGARRAARGANAPQRGAAPRE